MIDNDGMPELVRAIMARLNQWSQDPLTPPPFRSRSTSVSRTITAQDTIGWYQFILGRVVRSFAETQQEHLQSIFKKRTGLRWVQALINKLWDVSWDMWAHRNGIKHNTVTHAEQRNLDMTQALLNEQAKKGTRGLLIRDHYMITNIEAAAALPLHNKNIWLSAILSARAAAAAYTVAAEEHLERARQALSLVSPRQAE
jgi:hypothetical protein